MGQVMVPVTVANEPLVGYTVLELSNVVVDMVTHRLVARKYYDLKTAAVAWSPLVAPRGPVLTHCHDHSARRETHLRRLAREPAAGPLAA